jgi:hypothetical protein
MLGRNYISIHVLSAVMLGDLLILGTTTFITMTLSIMTLSIKALSVTTLGIRTLRITVLVSVKPTMLCVIMWGVIILNVVAPKISPSSIFSFLGIIRLLLVQHVGHPISLQFIRK